MMVSTWAVVSLLSLLSNIPLPMEIRCRPNREILKTCGVPHAQPSGPKQDKRQSTWDEDCSFATKKGPHSTLPHPPEVVSSVVYSMKKVEDADRFSLRNITKAAPTQHNLRSKSALTPKYIAGRRGTKYVSVEAGKRLGFRVSFYY